VSPPVKKEGTTIEILPPAVQGPEFDDPQFDRIKQVFGTEEIPPVQPDSLQTYFGYTYPKDNYPPRSVLSPKASHLW
jgi:hypothetical protein